MSSAQGRPCLADAAQKSRVVLESVLKPIILILKAHENAGRLPVTRDDDLATGREAEVA